MISPFLLASAIIVFASPVKKLDLDSLVLAIEHKENNSWSAPGGKAGWQKNTWFQFTNLPYAHASLVTPSRMVMKWALKSYADRFEMADIAPTYWRLAMAWRFGWDGAIRARRKEDDYGSCVEALASDVSSNEKPRP